MMFAPGYTEVAPPMVSVFTAGWGWMSEGIAAASPASATWESAGRAVYMPIYVPMVCIARRMWWANGATTTGGATVEVGIYADAGYKPGAKLVSGSAVQGTANQIQFVDTTDATLTPGLWWIALMASTTGSTTLFRSGLNTNYDETFRMDEASANPLPASATPAESSAGNAWLCGFSTTTIT